MTQSGYFYVLWVSRVEKQAMDQWKSVEGIARKTLVRGGALKDDLRGGNEDLKRWTKGRGVLTWAVGAPKAFFLISFLFLACHFSSGSFGRVGNVLGEQAGDFEGEICCVGSLSSAWDVSKELESFRDLEFLNIIMLYPLWCLLSVILLNLIFVFILYYYFVFVLNFLFYYCSFYIICLIYFIFYPSSFRFFLLMCF